VKDFFACFVAFSFRFRSAFPEDYQDLLQDEVTENPFGFLFSCSVTQCFASKPVTDEEVTFFSGN
jgi:hypothetical protein